MIVLKYLLVALLPLCYATVLDQKTSEIGDANPANNDAKDLYVNIGGNLYYITTGNGCYLSYNEAIQFCNDRGMGLVAFETLQENNDVINYILANGYNNHFWTSGKYIDFVMLWTSTGEIITYDNWGPNPPCDASNCGIALNTLNNPEQPTYWIRDFTYASRCPICEEFH